jgi:DNA/RNA endonuclease G (NUC1)
VNFNTYFGYLDDSGMGMMEKLPPFTFGDGVARVIDHMWVTNTTYVYNQLQKAGFGSTYVLSDESTFKIIAYGYESDDDDEPTTAEFYLLNKGKKFVTEWTKWDLSLLGKVVKVAFKYISTTSKSGTWEVCNFSVTGTVNGGGTTPTPDPDPTPDPTPSTARYNWAELPVITDANNDGVHDNDSNLYYAHHICAGGESNAQRNDTARNYTVCYSGKHHCPLWVAAPRHKSYESGASRTDAYGKDPKIPSDVQYNSKSTGGGCNKGHMLGSAERLSSTATNKQVFYYTNIAPQYSDTFNTGGGAWNNLEDHIDGLVCSDTLYVVIGCYFDRFSRNGATASPKTISFGGRSDVSCPTMFYYALLRTKKGNTGRRVQDCSASELQCAAFTICHEMEKGHKPQAADMMSISELEKLTGVSYFTNVPNAPKTTFSSSDWL